MAGFPQGIAVFGGSVWAGVAGQGPDSNTVLRIDPRTRQITARIRIPGTGPYGLAAGEGSIWATEFPAGHFSGPSDVVRVDVSTNRVNATIPLSQPSVSLAVGNGFVWASPNGREALLWIDPSTNRIAGRVNPSGDGGGAVVLADGTLWILRVPNDESIARYDIRPR